MKRRSRRSPRERYCSVHTLIGNDVYNRETDELGDIHDIVMDLRTGRIGFAVLRCRAEPTVDEKLVAVPWCRLTLDLRLRCFVLDLSVARLRAAPAFDRLHSLPMPALPVFDNAPTP